MSRSTRKSASTAAAASALAEFRLKPLAAALAAGLFALPQPVQAATITVTDSCGIRAAIDSANSDTAQGGCPAGSGADIIVLAAASTVSLGAGTLPAISSPITIQGNGSRIERLGNAAAFRLMSVTATGDLTLNDLTIANGQDTSGVGGGGIRSEGRLVLNRSTVTGNHSTGAGGGIAVANGRFELNDSTVSANSAATYGGGLRLGGGAPITTAIRGSTITGNTSGNTGGGLDMRVIGDGLRQTIDRSTISNNSAGTSGGGINSTDSLTITNSTISGNTAAKYGGGGIYHGRGPLILQGTTVADNRADTYGGGGGIATRYGSLELINSTVSGNRSASYNGGGGGIVHFGGEGAVNLRYSTVSGNFAQTGYGGGINSQAPVTLSNSQVTGNTAYNGAGGIYAAGVTLAIAYSSVSNNTTTYGDGGGVLIVSRGSTLPGSLVMSNSTVSGNRSGFSAGGILVSFDARGDISNSTIASNTASGFAGGVLTRRATLAIRNSTITGNVAETTTAFDGGGIAHGQGLLTLGRNIISGNGAPNSTSGTGKEITKQVASGTIVSEGFNVLGSSAFTNAQAFQGFSPIASDRTATSNGTHPTAIDNILGAGPAAIGGPTLAFNTRGVSPARDFIPSALCEGEVDQRGVVRPKNGIGGVTANECDAGSVESAGFNAVDLSITKTSNGPVFVGNPLTFSITVRNDGPEPANGIEVFDTLPAGLEFASSNDSNPALGECGEVSGTVECRLRQLAPASQFTFNLVARTTAVGPVTNEVSFLNDTLINTNPPGTDFDAAVTTQVLGPTVSLSVTPASIAEAGGSATLRATLSQAVGIPVVVNLDYTGSASSLADFTGPASITVPAGATSATAPLTSVADVLDEDDETIIASISGVPNGVIGSPNSATVSITDDDATPTVSFTLAEQVADEGTSRTVTAGLSTVSGRAVTVPIDFAGTAANPADYSHSATSIVIPAGAASASLTLSSVDDTLDEPNETVVMSFGTLVDAIAGDVTTQTVTIVDNDAPPSISFVGTTQTMDEAAGTVTVSMTMSHASGLGVTVPLIFTGTATNPADYSPSATTLTVAAGATSGAITLSLVDDDFDEADETVAITAGTPVNANFVGPTVQTVTITDNDAAPDITPDAFSFSDVSNVAPGSLRTSNPIIVTGINAATTVSVTGGFYSLNGGPCTLTSGTAVNTDSIQVCHTASASFSTATDTTLTLGANGVLTGVSDTFTSTTLAGQTIDITPDPFGFASEALISINTRRTSKNILITGYAAVTTIRVSAGSQYSIGCKSNAFTDQPGMISPGQSVCVRHMSSPYLGTTVTTTLTIGGIDGTYSTTTNPPDSRPNNFSFPTTTGVAVNSVNTSASITVGGINTASPISVSAGSFYSIGGGPFVNTPGTVLNGDTVRVRTTASNRRNISVVATLTIGGINGLYRVTTAK